jgi:hypothetical protein
MYSPFLRKILEAVSTCMTSYHPKHQVRKRSLFPFWPLARVLCWGARRQPSSFRLETILWHVRAPLFLQCHQPAPSEGTGVVLLLSFLLLI